MMQNILLFLCIGLFAGWLASVFVKGRGFGVLGDILIGVIGSESGGCIYSVIGPSVYGLMGIVIVSFSGSVMLLSVAKLMKTVSKYWIKIFYEKRSNKFHREDAVQAGWRNSPRGAILKKIVPSSR